MRIRTEKLIIMTIDNILILLPMNMSCVDEFFRRCKYKYQAQMYLQKE